MAKNFTIGAVLPARPSKLGMYAEGKNINRSTDSIVGGVDEALIVGDQSVKLEGLSTVGAAAERQPILDHGRGCKLDC